MNLVGTSSSRPSWAFMSPDTDEVPSTFLIGIRKRKSKSRRSFAGICLTESESKALKSY